MHSFKTRVFAVFTLLLMTTVFGLSSFNANAEGNTAAEFTTGAAGGVVLLNATGVAPRVAATPPDMVGANDVGTASSGKVVEVNAPEAICLPVNGVLSTGDAVSTERTFRDGTGTTCAVAEAYPGNTGAGSFRYDVHTFTNNSNSTCVTVTVDAVGSPSFIFPVAYVGGFDPTNLATNYAGDPGSSPNPTQTFSFNVPIGSTFQIVVMDVTSGLATDNPYTITTSACAEACIAAPTGQAVWYKADGDIPPVVIDSAGVPDNAVWENVPAYTAGAVGQAFDFTGTNSIVAANNGTALNFGAAPNTGMTFNAYIAPTITASVPIIEYNTGVDEGVHFFANFPNTGQLYLNLEDNTGTSHIVETATAPLQNDGSFQNVGFSYDSATGNVSIYYNGVAQPLTAGSGATATGDPTVVTVGNITLQTGAGYNLYIGRRATGGFGNFLGRIDEVQLYNRALTPTEVATIQTAVLGVCPTSSFQFSTAAQSTNEGTIATVTVTRTGDTSTGQSVKIRTVDQTANGNNANCPNGADYEATPLGDVTITFAPGETVKTYNIGICSDNIFEGNETFQVVLVPQTNTGNSVIGSPSTQTITIIDQTPAPTYVITATTSPVIEGNNLVYTITKTGAAQANQVVCYTTANGQAPTATAGLDYTVTTGCVTFTPGGPNTAQVIVPTIDDALVENTENVNLQITTINGVAPAGVIEAQGQILDNDSTFSIVAIPTSGPESDTTATFRVTRTTGGAPSTTTATVDIATFPGTAVGGASCLAGIDYVTTGDTLVFAPGVSFIDFDVTVCNDSVFENDEAFEARLSNPQGATITAPAAATYTITNDDAAPTFTLSCAITPQAEGSTFTYTVTRNGATAVGSSVAYTVTPNAPTTGGDINVTSPNPLVFGVGDTTRTITVVAVQDNVFEPNETFTVTLGNATTGTSVTAQTGTCTSTINNDDAAPAYSVGDVTQNEGNAGNNPFVFTITRTGDTQFTETITVNTQDGPAPAGATGGLVACGPPTQDYTHLVNATVTFAPGETSKQIPVIVCGDTLFEQTETFFVNLTNASAGGTFADAQGVGTIVNDDNPPTITISNASVVEGNAGTTNLVFNVTSTGNSDLTTVVTYNTVGVTATGGAACGAGIDYISQTGGIVSFGPGETAKTITVTVCGDTVFEIDETLQIVVTNATNAVNPVAPATGTIVNDDAAPTFTLTCVASVAEGNAGTTPVTYTITRSGSSEVNSTVTYTVTPVGTTVVGGAGADVSPATGTVTFGPGTGGTQTFTLNVTGDTVFEPNEAFVVTLTGGATAIIGGSPCTTTITNDDTLVFSINNVSLAEGNAGVTNFVFTVTRTGTVETSTSVTYQTVNGTATGGAACGNVGVDYIAQPPLSTIVFAPGSSTQTITVPVCGDLLQEPDETFQVVLTGTTQGTITPGAIGTANSGTGTILNDDGFPICIGGNIQQFNAPSANTNLAGITVNLTGTTTATTTTDANGNYQFCGLLAGGSYLVTPVAGAGQAFDPTSRSYANQGTTVTNANFVRYGAPGSANPRTLTIQNGYTVAGSPVTVPVVLNSLGDEAALSFSISYDPTRLSNPTVVCGTAGCADLTVNTTVPGQIGIEVEPASATYAAGLREVVRITFQTTAGMTTNTALTFTDVPAIRRTSDSFGNPLPTVYRDSTTAIIGNFGFVVFQQGFESDVAPRFTGDGAVLSNDVVQMRRFVTGLDVPNPAFNEFQRADAAPRATLGDGQLDATDVIQARRYAAGLDPLTPAGGPFGPIVPPIAPEESMAMSEAGAVGRTIRAVSTVGCPGFNSNVSIVLDSEGNEVAASFTVNFNPAVLTNPVVTLGNGVPAGTTLTINSNNVAAGQIGILVDSANAFQVSPPARQIVNIQFQVVGGTPAGATPITFGGVPTPQSVSDALANLLPTTYEAGQIVIGGAACTTAAGVTVGGRVTTESGAGLRNATVVLTDSEGNTRSVTTSSLGFYSIDDVAAGETYVVRVVAKRYRFASRVVQVNDSLSNIDFVGQE